MKRLLPLFIGIFAATLAAGAGFGFKRSQLLAAAEAAVRADSSHADSSRADSTHSDSTRDDSTRADSTRADSTGGAATHADSAGRAFALGSSDDPEGAARASAAAYGGREVPVDSADTVGTHAETIAVNPPLAPPAIASRRAATEATPVVTVERLAKIFGTMAPRDAAKVLAELSDKDVQTLIAHLSDRQAAAVMGSIPPERAAKITGNALRIARESPL